LKRFFEFGNNFIRFDKVCAIKSLIRSSNDDEITDQVLVFTQGGHEISIPIIETQRFLKEWRAYLSGLSYLPSSYD
jgi:hypothetical protein